MKQYTDLKFANLGDLFVSVLDESKRQIDKWGIQTHSLFEWLNYTTEELGELAKAIAENEYRNGTAADIYKEAIQVATLCLKIAEMINEKNKYQHDDACLDHNVDRELHECICEKNVK